MTRRAGIICAGNWIVDIVHEIDHWPDESDLVRITAQDKDIGGGAANVISALSKLDTGILLWPMGAVGDDDFGRDVTARCVELGLAGDLMVIKPDVATAHTHVMSVTAQSRTFFYQGGANDLLAFDDFPNAALKRTNARLFYLGYLTLLAELDRIAPDGRSGAGDVLRQARDLGMTTCVDLVSVARPDFRAIVQAAVAHIDYLILNEVELARATGMTPAPDGATPTQAGLQAMAQSLIASGVRQAVIVHCPQFAVWVGADGRVVAMAVDPLPRDEIGGPLGAGDAFCAGILYALHENWAPDRALALAHAVARASLRDVKASTAIPALRDLSGV